MKKVLSLVAASVMAISLTACSSSTGDLKMGQVQYAAHGTKSFAVTTVVMDGDKIAKAHIDEYQFLAADEAVLVPNSDADFGANYADPTKGLASKRVNDKMYSENMKEAGSTQALSVSYDAIQEYAEGKTVAELEEAVSGDILDAVSSSTLVDTEGYVNSIIEAAKAAK